MFYVMFLCHVLCSKAKSKAAKSWNDLKVLSLQVLLISDGIDENVQNGKDLFKYMIQCGSIGPCNLDHLADMLQEIHRRDLAERVRKFQSDGMFLLFLSL